MLTFRVEQIFKEKGIKGRYKLLLKAGFDYSAAYRLLKGKRETITLRQLENLCLLLQCNPMDILEWKPNPNTPLDEHHPLFPMIRTTKPALAERIKNIPYDKLADLEKFMAEQGI